MLDLKLKFKRHILNIENAYLLTLAIFLILLYNYTNIHGNWFIHPDDHATWVFSKYLSETGSLFIENQFNLILDYPAISPTPHSIYINGGFVPMKPVGEYYLFAFGLPFSDTFPYYISSILGLINIYFFFGLIKQLYDRKTALVSIFLFGLSFPIIYWSNMLYSNIAALAFFTTGLYYLSRGKGDTTISNYSLSFLFFAISGWLRYEYLIFTLIIITIFSKKIFYMLSIKKILILFIIFAIVLLPFFLTNSELYGSPFTIGYTYEPGEIVNPIEETTLNQSLVQKISNTFEKLYLRFFTQYLDMNIERIKMNAKDWMFNINIYLIPFFILGMLIAIVDHKNREFFVSIILISILWSHDTLSGYHWGENTNWLGNTYIRYLLIVYLTMVIYSSLAVIKLLSISNKKIVTIVIGILLITHVSYTMDMLFNGDMGLRDTTIMKESNYRINLLVSTYPENSIFVSNFASKYIITQKVFDTEKIQGDKEYKQIATIKSIISLLDNEYPVYLLEDSSHQKSYLQLEQYVTENFNDVLILDIVNENPSIYKVTKRHKF